MIHDRPAWQPSSVSSSNSARSSRSGRRASHGGPLGVPGWQAAAHETPRDTLNRELLEELGIQVAHARPLLGVTHRYAPDSPPVHIDCWRVDAWRGEIRALDAQAFRWCEREELVEMDILEADAPIVTALRLPDVFVRVEDEETLAERVRFLGAYRAGGTMMALLSIDRLFQSDFDDGSARPSGAGAGTIRPSPPLSPCPNAASAGACPTSSHGSRTGGKRGMKPKASKGAGGFYARRDEMVDAAIFDDRLSRSSIRVFSAIKRHWRPDNLTAWPGRGLIAQIAKCNERTVSRASREIEATRLHHRQARRHERRPICDA